MKAPNAPRTAGGDSRELALLVLLRRWRPEHRLTGHLTAELVPRAPLAVSEHVHRVRRDPAKEQRANEGKQQTTLAEREREAVWSRGVA